MGNSKTINFFSSSDNENHNIFILPHICFTLHHVENSSCEIIIFNAKEFKEKNKIALKLIEDIYPQKVLIREIPEKFLILKNYGKILGQIVRFLDVPTIISDYTYIGDIDIITMDPNIVSTHEKFLKQQELPYSNIIRANTKRLTGCMFVDYEGYYSKMRSVFDKFLKDPKTFYHPIFNDEELLYKLVVPRLGSPKYNDTKFRPIHGIHISLNRPEPLEINGIPGWGVNKTKLDTFKEFESTEFYQKIYPYFDEKFKTMINKLNNIKLN